MKKILYFMMAVLALSLTAVSCNDDDDVTFSTTPEIAAAGTYVGTYTKVLDGETDTTYAAGTVIITAGSAYQADIAFDAGDLGYTGSSIANIRHANDGFVFENVSTNNGLGTAFSGRIYGNGTLVTTFSTSERVGRQNYTYIYAFTGVKQ